VSFGACALLAGLAAARSVAGPTGPPPVPAPAAKPSGRPNVVFVLADDWGWGDLGAYGNGRLKTPNLDHLAEQGTLFTQFYAAAPVCSPSRAALLTGRFPGELGIHLVLAQPEQNRQHGMPDWLDPNLPMVNRLLQKAGYVTGHYGKWHLGRGKKAPWPDAYGFDEWRLSAAAPVNEGEFYLHPPAVRATSSEKIIDETIRFIERHKDQSFYVQAWLQDTHATLNPTEEQMAPYADLAPPGVAFKSAAQIYYAAATDADRHVGRLLERLDQLGLAENTIVVFSSDNGPEDMEVRNAGHSGVGSPGPFRGRKRSLYDGGVRMPFIVRGPGVRPGHVDDTSIVSGVDWLPTVCALAGVTLPKGLVLDGEDVSGTWHGRARERTRPLMWEWRGEVVGPVWNASPRLAIRDGRWKLLMNPDRSRVELYDIPSQATELQNLADRHPDVVRRLSERLLAWHATLPKGPVDPDAGSDAYPFPKEGTRPSKDRARRDRRGDPE
jgi:arylsulfatase A-like enzyme